MAMFPGDMNIGWGFGLESQGEISESFLDELAKRPGNFERLDEPLPPFQLTDPLLAVSELEQKVNDLVERLRTLTIVINGQVDSIELLFEQQNSQNERLVSIEQLLSTWTTK